MPINSVRRWIRSLRSAVLDSGNSTTPETESAVEIALSAARQNVPTLWLLGKSGAGKTTLIHHLTSDSRAVIGNGYAPCTKTSVQYDFPASQPIVRFIDSRGLGDAHYDSTAELAVCKQSSHALVVMARNDDSDQTVVLQALRQLGASARQQPFLLLHTAFDTNLTESDQKRAENHLLRQLEELGLSPDHQLRLPLGDHDQAPREAALQQLTDALASVLPRLMPLFIRQSRRIAEPQAFAHHRPIIIGHATAAAGADLVPGAGLIAVPGIQGKMLRNLASAYDVRWNEARLRAFVSALGTSTLLRAGVGLVARQVGKFIPLYGQTLGAATAATISFATTYALGRAACVYLFRERHDMPFDEQAVRRAFLDALRQPPANNPP